ncbi:MAG: radical SAM protein [Alphaproteobacteria bacterium]|nr:radical SAM protein [Alphaproteobacteria bacterium]
MLSLFERKAGSLSSRPRVLFANPPWWLSPGRGRRPDGAEFDYWLAGVRAGSRWPFTLPTFCAPDNFRFGGYLPYPFFLGYAASYARAKTGADVVLRDSIAMRESYDRFLAFVAAGRFDIMFFESATPSWEHDSALIRRIKALHPDMKIAVTGPIASVAERVFKEAPVAAVIRGEYEKGSVRVIEGAEGLIDFDLLTEEEMNAAPIPHYDQKIGHRYWDSNPKGQKPPHAQVWSSRGCPYKCIFCVWPATMTGNDPDGTRKRSVRQYSADYMEAFLTELIGRFQYRSIYFDDDTFNLGDRHVLAMCGVMTKLGVPWSAMCRADTIKPDTWKAMRDSGCFGVKIGFESGNQHVVDNIVNKRLDLEAARETVHLLKRLGMTVHGTFTYGLPGETREQMLDTKRFIASLDFDSVQESGTAEIEGTPLHTLASAGELKRYKAARLDEDYERDTDGARKARRLVSQLQIGPTAQPDSD